MLDSFFIKADELLYKSCITGSLNLYKLSARPQEVQIVTCSALLGYCKSSIMMEVFITFLHFHPCIPIPALIARGGPGIALALEHVYAAKI